MTVTCIDNDGMNLTVGKQYTVHSEDGDWIYIVNDVGSLSYYHRKYFS